MTFGISGTSFPFTLIQLLANGSVNAGQILAANSNDMISLTVIVSVATAPTTLSLSNASGANFTPASSGSGDPSAYLTVVKLSP